MSVIFTSLYNREDIYMYMFDQFSSSSKTDSRRKWLESSGYRNCQTETSLIRSAFVFFIHTFASSTKNRTLNMQTILGKPS